MPPTCPCKGRRAERCYFFFLLGAKVRLPKAGASVCLPACQAVTAINTQHQVAELVGHQLGEGKLLGKGLLSVVSKWDPKVSRGHSNAWKGVLGKAAGKETGKDQAKENEAGNGVRGDRMREEGSALA